MKDASVGLRREGGRLSSRRPVTTSPGQVHLDGHGNDQRLRASRWVNERLRRSRSHSCATREVPRDGPCESNDEFNETTTKLTSQNVELDMAMRQDLWWHSGEQVRSESR